MKWLIAVCGLLCWPLLAKDAADGNALPLLARCEAGDAGRVQCPLDTSHGVQMVRQLSGNQCIRGGEWGVGPDHVWVANGCRAEFRATVPGDGRPSRRVVRCDSDGRQVACPVMLGGVPVRLLRQLSVWPCKQGRSWGVRRNEIWVSRGCHGEFELGAEDGSGFVDVPRRIVCESKGRARRLCGTTVERGVRLLKQISGTACVERQSWGWDRHGIWVDKGCRAEFIVQ
jgi:hypothetical protein